MRFEFYKILDSKYVDDFINGNLYMNTLNYFRGVENNTAQGDSLEGVCGSIRKDQLKQFGMYFDDDLVNAIQGNVYLLSDFYGFNNLFCLYKLPIDDKNKVISLPKKELYKFNGESDSDKVVIHIKDTQKFLNQINTAINSGIKKHDFEYCIYGSVIYSNIWDNADGPGTRSAFHKDPEYAYQNEWRICILRNSLIDRPYSFSIGDLSNITEIVTLEEFLTHLESSYPGYSTTNEQLVDLADAFSVFGNIDAVNHLMFSYMAPSKNDHIRSDQAQADWYYAQYLQLTGNSKKIDSYLDAQMKEFRDIDHLELLVQYRLSVGEWVRATDAFMFFIDNAPNVIKENPEDFFFPLHTILMQHKEAADAGMLYKIATNKYCLKDGIKNAMQSDILFALGFYDQAITLHLKIKENSADPVLDFYLAVSYLHVLDFEKAHQHLAIYERYFSHSTHTAQKVEHLRMLINCFRNKSQLEIEAKAHVFEELIWNDELEELIVKAQQTKIFLGLESLYQLEKAQKWDLVKKFNIIIICPLTIAKTIDMYIQSGDPTFFHIIIRLARFPSIEIKSPELDCYLALDISREDMPEYIKMEQALYLQECNNKELIERQNINL